MNGKLRIVIHGYLPREFEQEFKQVNSDSDTLVRNVITYQPLPLKIIWDNYDSTEYEADFSTGILECSFISGRHANPRVIKTLILNVPNQNLQGRFRLLCFEYSELAGQIRIGKFLTCEAEVVNYPDKVAFVCLRKPA